VADLVHSPSPKRKKFDIWTPEQLNAFLEAVQNHKWYPIYVVAAYTGMRQGEILGIHKADIDLAKGIIHVNHAVQSVIGEGLIVTQPKTESSRRPITLPDTALEVLKEHLENVEDGLIFTTRSGKPISARNIVRHFKRVIEEIGLPEIRFHDLRHTHASLLLKAGVNPKVVQERLGHSQISLTLDTYSHVVPSLQEEAAGKFEEVMS
jgi:integrase